MSLAYFINYIPKLVKHFSAYDAEKEKEPINKVKIILR